MRRCVDLTDKRFGLLRACWPVGRDRHWHVVWLCVCDCGKLVTVHVGNLNRSKNNTESCGCLKKLFKKLLQGEAGFNALYAEYQERARQKGFDFALSERQFQLLTSSACFYCGLLPAQTVNVGKGWGNYTYNGIDRLRNKEGYVPGNVISCCKTCNWMKGTLDNITFVHWCRKIVVNTKHVL